MVKSERIAALIVAGGKGNRTGADLPKQYALLAGLPVIAHSYDAFAAHPLITSIHIVIGAGQNALLDQALAGRSPATITVGGSERRDSVRCGLDAIAVSGGADKILIHDAARPLLSSQVIDRLLGALETNDGAVPALPVADTLAHFSTVLGPVIDRADIVRVQTPQAFRFDAIMASHVQWLGDCPTDDAQMARAAGYSVAAIEGDPMLDKITLAADFSAAEARLAGGLISRCGMGFDVHKLAPDLPLWLCGIEFEHSRGLVGHSDADVVLHAIVDALLGAVGAGDIGDHFPPTDARWRGAPSSTFVEFARDLIVSGGGIIDHVDATIICEMPKIGPHRQRMRERLAELLKIDIKRISIKATTSEQLGFTGRSEGIAAQAIATVRSQ